MLQTVANDTTLYRIENSTFFKLYDLDLVKSQAFGVLWGIIFAFVCSFHLGNEFVYMNFGSIPGDFVENAFCDCYVTNLMNRLESLYDESTIFALGSKLSILRVASNTTQQCNSDRHV